MTDNKLKQFRKSEPIRFALVLEALLGLVVSFGLKLTADQVVYLMILLSAVAAEYARRRVAPVTESRG